MKFLLSSLYGRISAIFLVLLLSLSLVQLWVGVYSARKFSHESDQKLNQGLARDLVKTFQPALQSGLDRQVIDRLIHDLMVYNPRVEIYLLDERGGILAYFAGERTLETTRVDLAPIAAFLDKSRVPAYPLYGEDPRHPGKRKPFSAAPLTIGNQPGYLYLILGGEQYESVATMMEESYIVRTTVITLTAASLLIGLAGLVVFFLLTKRLRAMMSVVRAFKAGNYTERVSETSMDEIGQLGRAFNEMADQVAATLDRLRASDANRRELIANVSHDLRSPLTSAQGYLETLQMKEAELDAEERRRFLEIIYDNILRLGTMVKELFELSKLDAGQIQPHLEPFSVSELAQDVVMKFQPQAREGNVALSSTSARNLPFVTADIGLIERVLVNLIDNAIRSTPPQGRVEVRLSACTKGVQVRVADTGQGIPPDALPYVFDRFFRVDKSRTRSSGGSGLGLAIVKRILDLHQCDISVKSTPHQGTEFLFALAVQPPSSLREFRSP